MIRTCVNGLCTDKKLVSDSLGTSGHSSSQSKKTRCVNGNCEEVTTTCTNGVCTESKSSNTGSSSYNPPIQTHYDVPAYRQYTAFPNEGIGFQGNLNDGFGSVYNREPRPIYNNEESRHYYNNEESSQYHNNGGPTPIYNNVQSRNQEKHTECVNGVCKTVTKTCNNGNCETTTQ